MMKFFCTARNSIFEDQGTKQEFNSAIYGPCFKYIAYCPGCDGVCEEYRASSSKKNGSTAQCSGGRCACCG